MGPAVTLQQNLDAFVLTVTGFTSKRFLRASLSAQSETCCWLLAVCLHPLQSHSISHWLSKACFRNLCSLHSMQTKDVEKGHKGYVKKIFASLLCGCRKSMILPVLQLAASGCGAE